MVRERNREEDSDRDMGKDWDTDTNLSIVKKQANLDKISGVSDPSK
jgi:hypothetical protein